MLKMIEKKNVQFIDGYLVDKKGRVYNTQPLVDAANCFARLAKITEFAIDNKDELSKVGKYLVLDLKEEFDDSFTMIAETPALDEHTAKVKKLFSEVRFSNSNDRMNQLLAGELRPLADFIAQDTFLFNEAEATTERMLGNICSISKDEMFEALSLYVSAESQGFIDKITIVG